MAAASVAALPDSTPRCGPTTEWLTAKVGAALGIDGLVVAELSR